VEKENSSGENMKKRYLILFLVMGIVLGNLLGLWLKLAFPR